MCSLIQGEELWSSTQNTRSDTEFFRQWGKDIHPILEHYCYDCHGDGAKKGGLDLERYPDLASMQKDSKTWEHILTHVDYRLMPPKEEEQLEKKEREKLINWINDAIFPSDIHDPGRTVPRRMNTIEYENTIHDLLGISSSLRSILPPDDSANGFDNNAHALSLSPAHIEKYLQTAEQALNQALVLGPMLPELTVFKGFDFKGDGQRSDDGVTLNYTGHTKISPRLKTAGDYRLKVIASASQAGREFARVQVSIAGNKLGDFQVKGHMREEKTFTLDLSLPEGRTDITLTFPNDFFDPENKNKQLRDRNLMIHRAILEGPLGVKREKPASHRRIFTARKIGQNDSSYAHQVLIHFAQKAFRRAVSHDEISPYIALALKMRKQHNSLESGIQSALTAMLVSPSFLFIAPDFSPVPDRNKPRLINEYALASRLSYFLWSSMPDDELMALADQGQLRENLNAQITRMMKAPRAREMVRHFSGQWLQLRNLEFIAPNRKKFRLYSPSLGKDMRIETELLARHIFLNNQSLLDFIDADYSFINAPLAQLYGLSGIEGSHFRRVNIADENRRGILTHASILTLTSQPNRTSPVLRGKFVLENILDITPPPPPPEVTALDEVHGLHQKMTMREQLAMHRKKKACAGCHNLMDPVGLAFENYNGIGVWRDFENGQPIDSSGKLVTGEILRGAESLRLVILHDKRDEFLRCLTVKLMTYAIGRGVTRQDRLHIDKILSKLKKERYHAHALIQGIIHSTPFQYQRH